MSTLYYPPHQQIVSDGGIFRLHLTQSVNRNTGQVETFNISLGGKDRKCLHLRIPAPQTNKTDGFLSWVEAHDECSFERFIEKKATQHMIQLALSIAKSIHPAIKTIHFDDVSNITCAFPDGKEQKIPLKPFHIAFHQATWYEYYFDAKLLKDYDKYVALKENFSDPKYKPPTFEFKHAELQEILDPLYQRTATWQAFFQEIAQLYKDKKCTIVYPWLNDALYILFENNPYFESIKWYIDLEENKKKNKTAPIYFESYELKQKGGKRTRTHKQKQKSYRTYVYPNRPEVENWNYKTFLHN